jgi:hypothetical protein
VGLTAENDEFTAETAEGAETGKGSLPSAFLFYLRDLCVLCGEYNEVE